MENMQCLYPSYPKWCMIHLRYLMLRCRSVTCLASTLDVEFCYPSSEQQTLHRQETRCTWGHACLLLAAAEWRHGTASTSEHSTCIGSRCAAWASLEGTLATLRF